MGLDLSSLKKINTTTDSAPIMSPSIETRESAPIEASVVSAPIQTIIEPVVPSTVAPMVTPVIASAKISLSSLRGGPKPVEAPTSVVTPQPALNTAPTTIVEETHEKQPEGWQPIVITETPLTVEAIVHDAPTDIPFDLDEDEPQEVTKGIEEIAQEVIAEKQESLSLGSEEELPTTVVAEETEKKIEYFPNLDILGGLTFDDDFLGGEITSTETHSTILEINPMQATKSVEIIATEETPQIEAIATPEVIATTKNTISSEDVEEIVSVTVTDSISQELATQEEVTLAIDTTNEEGSAPEISEIIETKEKIGFITKFAGFFSMIGSKFGSSKNITRLEKTIDSTEVSTSETSPLIEIAMETPIVDMIPELPEDVKTSEINEIVPKKEEIGQSTEATLTEGATMDSSLSENIEISDPITPEYVTEIKQELSENRKIGGLARFKKIVVTVALSGVLLLGGIIGFNGMLKNIKPATKINILENAPQNPPVATTKPVVKEPTNPLATLSGTNNTGVPITNSGITSTGSMLVGSGVSTSTDITLSGTTSPAITNTGAILGTGTTIPPANTGTGETLSGTAIIAPSSYIEGDGYKSIPNTKKNIPRTK